MSQPEDTTTKNESPAPSPEPQEQSFAALLAESEAGEPQRQRIAAGEAINGRVIAVGDSAAFVEIGGKVEAVIDLAEFRDPGSGELRIQVGDRIEATVIDDGGGSGTVVLKRAFGRGGHVSGEIEQALAHGIGIEGLVSGENKGGFDVQIGAARAFCPGSQMDRRRGPAEQYVGQRLLFRVTKIENGGRNIVVSRRQLLEEESAAQAAATLERLAVGAVTSGTVTSVRDFGAFVDLGGIEGMVHVSELAHGRVEHPSQVLQPGQEVEVKVVRMDEDPKSGRPRIALSMRALAADPWSSAAERFPVGSTASGTVRRLEGFGAFVELAPGLEGLVHVSKMALDRRVAHPRQVVNVGDPVQVTVTAVDPGQRRMSLSMVEQARRERDGGEATQRVEEQAAVAQVNRAKSLGTFADLLKKDR